MDWKRIFDSLGLNGTWWQWRIARWREQWEAGRTRAENAAYRFRMCSNCGGLMDRDTAVCTRCGAALENWRKVQMRRAAGMLIPEGLTVSYLLMAANIIVMGVIAMAHGFSQVFQPSGTVLAFSGALAPEFIWAEGEWWRLLSYAFLHGGLLHIFFNIMSLSQVGPVCENEIGRARFISLYVLSALAGAGADLLWHHWFGSRPLVVGASGAIFGLIGFGLTYNFIYGGREGRRTSRIYFQWAVMSFAIGFMPGMHIDNVCHLGGFLMGALLGVIIQRDLQKGGRLRILWNIVATLSVAAIATALTLAAIAAVRFHNQFGNFQ